MDELTLAFEKSLFAENNDLVGDYLELGIDSFIDEGILEDLPIVKTIVSVLKLGKNLQDRNLLKQTLTFINEFNNNNISKEKLNKYKQKVESNHKKGQEELGRVILLVNRFIDREKSIMLARFFKAYINEMINWNEFCEFSEIVDRIFIQDLGVLKMIHIGTMIDTTNRNDMFRVERLNSLGLIGLTFKSSKVTTINGGMQQRQDNFLNMSNSGKKFMDIISR